MDIAEPSEKTQANSMASRREGRETWHRLLEWDKGQTASERLAGHLLRLEGFESIDPMHPLGGPDGGSDLFAIKDGKRWISAVYFPRGAQRFNEISGKFRKDFLGIAKNDASGLVFITNQELTKNQRKELEDIAAPTPVMLLHLERIASLLDSPAAYGLRLEFLDKEMSSEEQAAFFEWFEHERNNAVLGALHAQNQYLTDLITGGDSYPRAWFPACFKPDLQKMEGSISVIGDYPLLDVVIQVKMPFEKKGSGGSIAQGWMDDVSIGALYPGNSLRLNPWKVSLEHEGQPLRFVDLHVRARNGWFVQRCKLIDQGDGWYGTWDQVLYEVLGDEFREETWKKLRDVPGAIFRPKKRTADS